MARIINPYEGLSSGKWIKGNLHTHTTRSDGTHDPQVVIDNYYSRGYGFLMFSDHDTTAFEQDYLKWDSHGMVMIPGCEISANGPHILHVDANESIPPVAQRQDVLFRIATESKKTGRGFAIICHPNWEEKFDHCTINQMREWTGYTGMEIYNGVIGRLNGSPYATNKWDMLLTEGRRIWGFANDDSHRPDDIGLGWNIVRVEKQSISGVMESLQKGSFYCSTGVIISSIQVNGMGIRIETENARRIAAIKNTGMRFAVTDSRVIEIEAPPNAVYVRFECLGDVEQFAWTQPFFIENVNEGGMPNFIANWLVSSLKEDLDLERATFAEGIKSAIVPTVCAPAGSVASGFVDVRSQIQECSGVVYLATHIMSESDRRAIVSLGYDGPVRVWLNGALIFCGPGTNPALPDMVSVYGMLKKGENTLVIALDSNQGKAWGIFCRIR
jgi:hypothetical protein